MCNKAILHTCVFLVCNSNVIVAEMLLRICKDTCITGALL